MIIFQIFVGITLCLTSDEAMFSRKQMGPLYWNQKKIWNEMEEYPQFFG